MSDIIIFIHGLNSSCETDKYQAIKAKNKICTTVDHSKPLEVEKTLVSMIEENKGKNIILVGHSIGGFWARKMAKDFNLKALLLNPSFEISEQGRIDIGPAATKYYADNLHKFTPTKGVLFAVLELGDERVDQEKNATNLSSECRVLELPGGFHRFSRTSSIDNYIKTLRNNFT